MALTTVAALAAIVHLIVATWHVQFGALNPDEGFYAVATRAVAEGEVPYRDFGFTQPPLVLYVNSLPLRLVGFGLFPQRAINGLWAALALAGAVVWLARRTRPAWGIALGLFFSLSAPWMYFIHLGKTYGLTTFLVMLAAWVFLTLKPGPRRNFSLGLLAALGVGTRLPAAPFFAVLWLLALWPGRRPTAPECSAAFGGAAMGVTTVALPFWLVAPVAAKFWIFDFHRISVPFKNWRLAWQEIATLAPAVWLIAAFALICMLVRRRFATREAGLMLASSAALAANLLLGGVYEEYGVPFLLPLATAAGAILYEECKTRTAAFTLVLAATLVIAHVLAAPVLFHTTQPRRRHTLSQWLPFNAPPYNRALPAQLATARDLIKQSLPSDAPFIGPNIILAAQTGHRVPAELRMGPFAFTAELPPAQAARLHLATRPQLDAWFARPDVTMLSFFKRRELNYAWTMPSFNQLNADAHQQWFAPMHRDFSVVGDSRGDFALLARNAPAPPPAGPPSLSR